MRTITTGLLALALGAFAMTGPRAEATHGGRARACCPPPPAVPVVLQVCHPCTGCKIDVPVCIPACCVDAPCVRFQPTLIGDGKTVFSWQCGHEVVVRYTHNGGYRVIERG